mgnify:CR=1 FL=1
MEAAVSRLPFWQLLTEQERDTVQRSAMVRRYEKGTLIHDGGSRLYPGELCVLSASCVISQITFDTQMTAQQETEVLIIPAGLVAALTEQNLSVRCFLYELATKRFSDVMWAMQQILFKGLDRRLAEFLLSEAARTGSDTIRMTHEQLAQHISSAREAVARMLKTFSEEGLVELKRGVITLRDKDGLRQMV